MEGIEEALYWHTVGIVADSGRSTGTAVAIRFNRHTVFLTANHVIEGTGDEDLGFFFRPPGTLRRTDWWQNQPPSGRIAAAVRVKIFQRFPHPKLDLAALVVCPLLDQAVNVRFFDLPDAAKLSRPLPSVAAIGFPADTKQELSPVAAAVAAAPIWGNVECGKHWRPDGYRPRSHLLLRFLPASFGRHPGGFSGAGVWYHEPAPKPGLWTPNLALAGIVTHYYPGKQILLIQRVERVAEFLRAICPGPTQNK